MPSGLTRYKSWLISSMLIAFSAFALTSSSDVTSKYLIISTDQFSSSVDTAASFCSFFDSFAESEEIVSVHAVSPNTHAKMQNNSKNFLKLIFFILSHLYIRPFHAFYQVYPLSLYKASQTLQQHIFLYLQD